MPRSDIWKYFDSKILKNGKKEANCKDCPKIFVFSGSTTTLWRHIQTVHTVHPLPSNSSIKQESQKRKAQEIEVEIKSESSNKKPKEDDNQPKITKLMKSKTKCIKYFLKALIF